MDVKETSMNNRLSVSIIASIILVSGFSFAYADLIIRDIEVYCPTVTNTAFNGNGTYLEMCPLTYNVDHDLLWTPLAPVITNIENLGFQNVFANFTHPIVQGLSNITGMRIERTTTSTFSTLVNDTSDPVTLWFQDLTVNPGIFYKYRIAAWNDQGLGEYSNIASLVTITEIPSTFCDGVTNAFELQSLSVTSDSATICWDLFPTGSSITGYGINYTSPWADPDVVLVANSGTNATRSYLVENLQPNTQYSFRVIAIGDGSLTNRLDIITPGSEFDIGSFTVNTDTNPDFLPFRFSESLLNSTQTQLNVDFDNNLNNVTCAFTFKLGQTTNTYTNLSSTVLTDDLNRTSFVFNGVQNDIIDTYCYDGDIEGRYVIAQYSDFPLLDQIRNFRNGTYGTDGMMGAFDLITLFAIILSMIGFNRVNSAAGAIMTVIVIGVLAFLQIIEWPVIVLSAMALIVLLAVVTHSRDDVSE